MVNSLVIKHDDNFVNLKSSDKETVFNTLYEEVEYTILKHNTIILHGEIDKRLCSDISSKLTYLFLKKAKKINIVLNSVGGDVYHGLLLFNTLESLKRKGVKIEIEVRGLCASFAIYLLLGATKRIATKYSRLLIHELQAAHYGKVSDMKEEVEELEKINSMFEELIVERTKVTKEQLDKYVCKREWWLSSLEAKELGIIDEVI